MSFSMSQTLFPTLEIGLSVLSGLLDKAEAFAAAKKIDPSVLLNSRLAPDMFPFLRQVLVVCDQAKNGSSRLAGIEPPAFEDSETTIAELKARIAKTVDYLKGFKPAEIDGTEDKEITLKFGSNERKFTGLGLLLGHILPNFYFHCTTAYDILRHCGVELGKRDFMGTPVSL